MNNRANIMYFIEHLCDMSQRENHLDFVRMMQRDILRVVDAVAPSDGSGAANVKVVRRVLAGLQTKSILLPETVLEIEAGLAERDTLPGAHPALSPISPNTQREGRDVQVVEGGLVGGKANGVSRLDKRQVEQRIEEDRERHKRLRESIWAVGEEGEEGEFERLWEEADGIGEDDWVVAQEDAMERRVVGKVV
jgi:CTD kinase subunit gamma